MACGRDLQREEGLPMSLEQRLDPHWIHCAQWDGDQQFFMDDDLPEPDHDWFQEVETPLLTLARWGRQTRGTSHKQA